MIDALLIIIILIVCLEAVAISCVKQYHLSKQFEFFLAAVLFYAVVCYLLAKSFDYTTMGLTNVIWSGLSVFIVTVAGILLFKEEFHVHDLIATVFIMFGIIILKCTK